MALDLRCRGDCVKSPDVAHKPSALAGGGFFLYITLMAVPVVTRTTIANLALARVAEERVDNVEADQTRMAQLIRDIWDQAVVEVLEEHDWNSATNRQVLSPKAGVPDGPFTNWFDKPSDLVRLTAVWRYSEDDSGNPYHGGPFVNDFKLERESIYVGSSGGPFRNTLNASGQYACAYVRFDNADLGLWSPGLRRAIAMKLAVELSISTAGGAQYLSANEDAFERYLRKAQTRDTSREGSAFHSYSNHDLGGQESGYSQLMGTGGGIGSFQVS